MRYVTTALILASAIVASGHAQTMGYGPLEGKPSEQIPVAVDRTLVDPGWQDNGFYAITTELSPATLLLCRDPQVRFFTGLREWGLGAPTRLAVPCADTIRVLSTGDRMAGSDQTEAWLLAWFAGADGWTNFDVPWLLVLQHRASRIELGDDGLRLTFDGPCGYIASMPLFGTFKPPAGAGDFLAAQSLPSPGIQTSAWYVGLPAGVIQRCRLWSEFLREFPVDVRETFSVDRRRDAVTIRQQFTFIPIDDDFGTTHRKLGPLPPSLGLAWLVGGFPMRVSAPVYDPGMFTGYGPYIGVVDEDSYEIRMDVLQYIHETETQQPANVNRDPSVAQALEWIRARAAERWAGPADQLIWDHGGADNYCWQAMGDRWYPKVLTYLDPDVAAKAKAQLKHYFAAYVLNEANYKPFKDSLLLVGPGIGTWGGYDDAGKFSSNLLETIWCYAHYTGDWELIRERWPMIRKLFVTPLEMEWKTFGRRAIAEMGDEAAPPLCMARLAYHVGDADTYDYACYAFARELVHLYVKMKGADYFRQHQPADSTEAMAPPVYLTNLWGDTAGWRIDGPQYPAQTPERQYTNRWVRFTSEDVARFLRDRAGPELKAEMDGLAALGAASTYPPGKETAHIAPSLEHLRSLLLNEPPEQLAQITPADSRPQGRPADGFAYFYSFIRTSNEPALERVIPAGGDPSPFVVGIERTCRPEWSVLTQALMGSVQEGDQSRPAWPVPTWFGWKPPKEASGMPGSARWPFGQIVPGDGAAPAAQSTVPLSWVTQVMTYDRSGGA